MNKPREFDESVTGVKLFGSELPDSALAKEEVYDVDEAAIIDLHRFTGHFQEGGPQFDIDELVRLRMESLENPEVKSELTSLMKHELWFRFQSVLNRLESNQESEDARSPS